MSRSIRFILSAFVLVCLAAGPAQALPTRPAFAMPGVTSVLDAAWSWLVGRLRPVEPAKPRQDGSWQQKYGCGMDPDGKPKPCDN